MAGFRVSTTGRFGVPTEALTLTGGVDGIPWTFWYHYLVIQDVARAAKTRLGVRVLARLLWFLLLVLLVESGARAFWRLRFGLDLFHGGDEATAFYPSLAHVRSVSPSRGDGAIDILLLGGSTLSNEFGAIESLLRERLVLATGWPVRIFNLGTRAHTSRDSYVKYAALRDVAFDLVLLYDGFNETRANNAPPDIFRDDYSHYAWYELVNDVAQRRRLRPLAAPYTAIYLGRSIGSRKIPPHRPDRTWTAYGHLLRTPAAFRRNVEGILALAAIRHERVILLTFAAYFPPGYSEEAFSDRRLDYALHLFPIEHWGEPKNVAAGLEAHNEVLRSLHRARPDIGFVDMATILPRGRTYFNDVCHLTVEGSERFVDALCPVVLSELDGTVFARSSPARGSNRPTKTSSDLVR